MLQSLLAEASLSVPVGWVLASGATLAGSISYLAKLVYASQNRQIDILRDEIKEMRHISSARSETIAAQNRIIVSLQEDIKDLKRGCGAEGCVFVKRQLVTGSGNLSKD